MIEVTIQDACAESDMYRFDATTNSYREFNMGRAHLYYRTQCGALKATLTNVRLHILLRFGVPAEDRIEDALIGLAR